MEQTVLCALGRDACSLQTGGDRVGRGWLLDWFLSEEKLQNVSGNLNRGRTGLVRSWSGLMGSDTGRPRGNSIFLCSHPCWYKFQRQALYPGDASLAQY